VGRLAPALVVSIPFIYVLVRAPVLRRLAVRNAARRPREALLVVLGALLGTAIITSSGIVGDTLRASFRGSVVTQLGPVDEEILSDGAANGAAVATATKAAFAAGNLRGVHGVLPLVTIPASVATVGAAPRAEPRAQLIETDFPAARAFGPDPAESGISGPTPRPGEAVIGADLAHLLATGVGGRVRAYAYGASVELEVVRVLPKRGVAGLRRVNEFSTRSANLFVPPGTIAQLARGSKPGTAPPTSVLAVSNEGGVFGSAALTRQVGPELYAAVAGLPARVSYVKQGELDFADARGQNFTSLFRNIGWFSVLAGVLLLVNIFVMLAQERKQTLGMLRAVGMRRASLVGSFSLEGWLYALASAASGALAGVGVGRLVVVAADRIFNSPAFGHERMPLHFAARARSVIGGFNTGFLIALLTVVISSLYVGRLNVIRAIRDLAEPPRARGRRAVAMASVVTAAGTGMTAGGVGGRNPLLVLSGPAVLAAGLVLSPGRAQTRTYRARVSVIALAVIAWEVFAFGLLRGTFRGASISVFVMQGVILVAYAVLLVTENQESVGAWLRVAGGGARNMSLRLGLAYPLAKRFRTGLTLAMYSIVVFFLVFLATFGHLFTRQADDLTRKASGGAALTVVSNATNPAPAAGVSALPGVTHVAAATEALAEFRHADRGSEARFDEGEALVGFDESLIGHGAPALSHVRGSPADDRDAYRAVMADPDKAIVPRELFNRHNGPPGPPLRLGQRILVRDPLSGRGRLLAVAGLVSQQGFGGGDEPVFVSRRTAVDLFGPRATARLLYVSTAPGTDNEALVNSIEGRFLANGADAETFRHRVLLGLSITGQFLDLVGGYVALGLLVGIAGLGVVMIRAVRERRREVGVLRSLGFGRVAVRRAFVAESLFVALEGIGVGAALALVTAWRTISGNAFGNSLRFSVPWVPLAVLVAVTGVASLAATAAPAVQASRIRPAVALRIAD